MRILWTTVAGLLILLTTLSWVVMVAIGGLDEAAIMAGVIPARLSGALELSPTVPAVLTPLSATLIHADLLHLGMNMLFLFLCGVLVERALGRGAMVLIYVVGAYAAALAQWAVDPMAAVPGIGASGAISAIIGAYALTYGRQKRLVRSPRLNRALNALWLLAAWVVIQLLVGWAAGLQGVLIAVPAHIGGFVAGLLLQRPLLLWRYRNA